MVSKLRCAICFVPFRRNEHLERHVVSMHIPNYAPFRCDPPCDFKCNRREALERHKRKVHPMYLAAAQLAEENRPPRRIACEECYKAKTKCDREVPCRRCISKNVQCHEKFGKRATETASPARITENLRSIQHNFEGHRAVRERAMRLRRNVHSSRRMHPHYPISQDPENPHQFQTPPQHINMNVQRPFQPDVKMKHQHGPFQTDVRMEHHHGFQFAYRGHPPTPPAQSSPVFKTSTSPVGHPVGPGDYAYEAKHEFGHIAPTSQSPMVSMGMDQTSMVSMRHIPTNQSFSKVQDTQMLVPHNMHIRLSYSELPDEMQTAMSPEGTAPGYWLPTNQDSPFSGSSDHNQPTPQLSCPSSSPEPFGIDVRSEYKSPREHLNGPWSMESVNNSLPPVLESSPQLIGQSPWIQCNAISDSDYPIEISTPKYVRHLADALRTCHAHTDWQPNITTAATSENLVRLSPFEESTRNQLKTLYQRIAVQHQQPEAAMQFPWIRDDHYATPSADPPIELPPVRMLDMCMEGFARKFEQFYPMLPISNPSPSALLQAGSDPNALSAFLLLMIAGGAEAIHAPAWSGLVSGLMECCRVALFVAGSRDVVAGDITRLRAALIFLHLGAWSGEKEHTDFVLSQRETYMDMLRRSGLLQQRQQNQRPQEGDATIGVQGDFQLWQKREATNRLFYSWVLVDQELDLFGDWKSSLDLNNLKLDLPCSDDVWKVVSAEEWAKIPKSRVSIPSLYTLYMQLRKSPGDLTGLSLTPLHLRLLLHPLQNQIFTLVSCLNNTRTTSPQQTKNQVAQLQTAQADLVKWYGLMQQSAGSVSEPTPFVTSNLIMYHLIFLNSMTYFPDIEEFARGHMTPAVYLETFWARNGKDARFPLEAPKIFWHCGSILRYFKELREPDRPRWLPVALYRAALTLWAASFTNGSPGAGQHPIVNVLFPNFPSNPEVFAFPIDRITSFHNNPAFEQYWHHHEGQQIAVPAFLDESSGTWVCLANIANILIYCAHLVKRYDGEGKLADRVHHDLLHLSEKSTL